MSWTAFLDHACASDHAVQLYAEGDELAIPVGRYLAAAFASGSPAVVIATADHGARFDRELRRRGWDVRALRRRGLLTVRDAEETLDAFMDGGRPSPELFERAVGGLLDGVAEAFPGRTLRAFGEMVDVLWQQGDREAAIAVEELWNDLARTRRFALLCAYRLDVFDLETQTDALPAVAHPHSHVQGAGDPARLASAVHKALAEVVGPVEAARVYLDAADQVGPGSLPRAQAILHWLSASDMPAAPQILARARSHYLRGRVPVGLAAPA